MKMKIKGQLTDCVTNEVSEVDVTTEIQLSEDNKRILYITEGGVTGYESFYIDHIGLPKELSMFETDLNRLVTSGWLACAGTKNRWNKLYIPGNEMKKALQEVLT